MTAAEHETEIRRETEHDLEFVVAEDLGDKAHVIVHNDDVTPFDFVIAVLCTIFQLNGRAALAITTQAHVSGAAYVTTLPYEDAKYRVGQAHQLARASGYPLSFTLELVKE